MSNSKPNKWKKVTAVGVTSAVAACLFFIWLTWIEKLNNSQSRAPTTDETPVSVIIGGERFAIPRNYIWSPVSELRNGQTSGVNLHALLPNLTAPSKATVERFKAPGWGDKITIVVRTQRMEGDANTVNAASMNPRETFERFVRGATNQADFNYGLHRLTAPRATDQTKDVFVGKKETGEFHWLLCSRPKEVVAPSCSSQIDLSKHVAVLYTFSIEYLGNWKQIDSDVAALIRSFQKQASQ